MTHLERLTWSNNQPIAVQLESILLLQLPLIQVVLLLMLLLVLTLNLQLVEVELMLSHSDLLSVIPIIGIRSLLTTSSLSRFMICNRVCFRLIASSRHFPSAIPSAYIIVLATL